MSHVYRLNWKSFRQQQILKNLYCLKLLKFSVFQLHVPSVETGEKQPCQRYETQKIIYF
jgi:hypothetical protein